MPITTRRSSQQSQNESSSQPAAITPQPSPKAAAASTFSEMWSAHVEGAILCDGGLPLPPQRLREMYKDAAEASNVSASARRRNAKANAGLKVSVDKRNYAAMRALFGAQFVEAIAVIRDNVSAPHLGHSVVEALDAYQAQISEVAGAYGTATQVWSAFFTGTHATLITELKALHGKDCDTQIRVAIAAIKAETAQQLPRTLATTLDALADSEAVAGREESEAHEEEEGGAAAAEEEEEESSEDFDARPKTQDLPASGEATQTQRPQNQMVSSMEVEAAQSEPHSQSQSQPQSQLQTSRRAGLQGGATAKKAQAPPPGAPPGPRPGPPGPPASSPADALVALLEEKLSAAVSELSSTQLELREAKETSARLAATGVQSAALLASKAAAHAREVEEVRGETLEAIAALKTEAAAERASLAQQLDAATRLSTTASEAAARDLESEAATVARCAAAEAALKSEADAARAVLAAERSAREGAQRALEESSARSRAAHERATATELAWAERLRAAAERAAAAEALCSALSQRLAGAAATEANAAAATKEAMMLRIECARLEGIATFERKMRERERELVDAATVRASDLDDRLQAAQAATRRGAFAKRARYEDGPSADATTPPPPSLKKQKKVAAEAAVAALI